MVAMRLFIKGALRMRKFVILTMVVGLATFASLVRAEEKDEGKEGKEQKIAFADAPKAVQATLTKEAEGNKIEQVDKESDEGKTIYEADVMLNGKNYEIKVAEDGTLLVKKLDMEEDK